MFGDTEQLDVVLAERGLVRVGDGKPHGVDHLGNPAERKVEALRQLASW